MVSQANSVSKRRGGARVGAGRPRLRQRVSETRSIGLAGLAPGTTSVTVADGDRTWHVRVERTPCNFGGYRTWLCCPSCTRRVRFLFFGKSVLACLQCLKLQHDSQLERPAERSRRRSRKLREQLTSFAKPKWMRWSTYERLCGALRMEHDLRTEIRGLVAGGERTAALRAQIALDASRAQNLTDKELSRAIDRVRKLRALPRRSLCDHR